MCTTYTLAHGQQKTICISLFGSSQTHTFKNYHLGHHQTMKYTICDWFGLRKSASRTRVHHFSNFTKTKRRTPCISTTTWTICATPRRKHDLRNVYVANACWADSRSPLRFDLWRLLQTPSNDQHSKHLCESFISSHWLWTLVARPGSLHMAMTDLFYNKQTPNHISTRWCFTSTSSQPACRLPGASSSQPTANSHRQVPTSQ